MRANSQSGFTLVEMIMVIVITGIIGSMVAVFLKAPVQQYMDVARRAELTDIADTAFQRLARDIRTAVPNSVRPTTTGSQYIEFLPTRTGGRYRANTGAGTLCNAVAGNTNGDALSFASGVADTCFEIIGPNITFATNDRIVVGSTQSDGSLPYDSTPTGVLRAYNGTVSVPQSSVVITSVTPEFPTSAELSSQRFQVVDGTQQAVTYSCEAVSGSDGPQRLVRHWGYWNVADPTNHLPYSTGGPSAILANNISYCNFVYDIVNQRNGLVAITLQITKDGETVSLYEEIHVNNAP